MQDDLFYPAAYISRGIYLSFSILYVMHFRYGWLKTINCEYRIGKLNELVLEDAFEQQKNDKMSSL